MAAVLAVMFVPGMEVFARGGGGQNYNSGGGGGGSGGGGGGGDGLVSLAIWLLIYSPLPWPIKIIVIIAIIYGLKRANSARRSPSVTSVSNEVVSQPYIPAAARPVINVGSQLADLKARDPNFSEQQFEDLASTAFFKIQEAWSKRDMSIARAYCSPALFQRFSSQLSGLKDAGKVNKMDNLAVGSVELVEAFPDGGFDYVTARVNASAADYTIDEKSGKIISGSKESSPFTEYWTFLRSDKVKTKAGAPTLEARQCPNCGAPLAINAVGKCDYCGSDVTSGQYNWVLSEISQASVWRPRSVAQPARPQNVSPLAGERYVLGLVKCPNCGANVQDIAGILNEHCWRCGAEVPTAK